MANYQFPLFCGQSHLYLELDSLETGKEVGEDVLKMSVEREVGFGTALSQKLPCPPIFSQTEKLTLSRI